jgi:hypothetical protein
MPNLMPIAVLDYRANGTRARSDGTRARFKGCRDNDNPDLPSLGDVPATLTCQQPHQHE